MLQTLGHVALSLLALIVPLALAWYLLGRQPPRRDTDRHPPPR